MPFFWLTVVSQSYTCCPVLLSSWVWNCSYQNPLTDDACMHVKLLQSCLNLCDPMDCNLLGSSVHGSPDKILEWVPWLPPGNLPDPGMEPVPFRSFALTGVFFTTEPVRKPLAEDFLLYSVNRKGWWEILR